MQLLGHQGDIAIFKAKAFPKGLIQDAQTKSGILASGTMSGHAHQVDDLTKATVFKDPTDGLLYLDVTAPVSITHGRMRDFSGKEADHDYHHPILLEPGIYAAGVVEETDWISKTVRKVID